MWCHQLELRVAGPPFWYYLSHMFCDLRVTKMCECCKSPVTEKEKCKFREVTTYCEERRFPVNFSIFSLRKAKSYKLLFKNTELKSEVMVLQIPINTLSLM